MAELLNFFSRAPSQVSQRKHLGEFPCVLNRQIMRSFKIILTLQSMQVRLRYLHSINMLKTQTKPGYQKQSAVKGVALHHDPNKKHETRGSFCNSCCMCCKITLMLITHPF